MRHEAKFIWFDAFRGIAALLVLIMHLRALIFVDFSDGMGLLDRFFYFLTGFGHEAVVIFFVLSGFFIVRSIHSSALQNRFDAFRYAKNRLIRLWIVLLPSLILTYLIDTLGMYLYPNAFTYAGLIQSLPDISPLGKLGGINFLGNLFFLQEILVETYGSNAALWSLSYEFWYYVIFPLLFFACLNFHSKITRVLLLSLGILLLIFVGGSIRLNFIIWLFGGFAYVVIRSDMFIKSRIRLKSISSFVIFCLVLTLIRLDIQPFLFNDFSLGLVTAIMLCPFSKLTMDSLIMRKILIPPIFRTGISQS